MEDLTPSTMFDQPVSKELKEKVTEALRKYRQMNQEQKDELQKAVFEAMKKSASKKIPFKELVPLWIATHTPCFAVILFALSTVGILFVAFGRRLYYEKREVEREKKEKEMREKGIEGEKEEDKDSDDSDEDDDEDESNDKEIKGAEEIKSHVEDHQKKKKA